MILFEAYLYTCNLIEGLPSKYLLQLNSYTLSLMILPLWVTFWKACFGISFIFWKLSEDIRTQIRGIGWVTHFSNRFLGQKLLDSSL